ncbi:SDR family oxidoreductase [Streptomyces mutabilis]|uniref:SDR family oxidoreductase n=1 Tax=Streptomyces mutabilis TaxID=67332 RepID=UPI0036CAD0F1
MIDVANIVTTRRKTAVDFFSRTTGNLIAAARAGGVAHLVTLSIVGSDEVDFGYYFGKRAQEELVRSGAVPWTVVRATQFFEFPEPLLDSASPVVVVPRMLTRPVAAQTLVEHAVGGPAGMAPEIAGPDQLDMVDMARRIARARGRRRLVVPVTLPGKVGKAMTTGGLLPRGEYLRGRRTFEAHLASLRAA